MTCICCFTVLSTVEKKFLIEHYKEKCKCWEIQCFVSGIRVQVRLLSSMSKDSEFWSERIQSHRNSKKRSRLLLFCFLYFVKTVSYWLALLTSNFLLPSLVSNILFIFFILNRIEDMLQNTMQITLMPCFQYVLIVDSCNNKDYPLHCTREQR